jgi:hypothetical protein
MIKSIKVREYLNTQMAVSTEKAEVIFNECKKSIEKGQAVCLNFDGVNLIITAFLNIAIGKVYGLNIDYDLIDKNLTFSCTTPSIEKMIERVQDNSKKFYSNRDKGRVANDILNKTIDGDI